MRWKTLPSLLTYHTYLMRVSLASEDLYKDSRIEHIINLVFDVLERNRIPSIKRLNCLEQKILLLSFMLKSFSPSSRDKYELFFRLLESIKKRELYECIIPEALMVLGLISYNLSGNERNVLGEETIRHLWKYRHHNYWRIRAALGLYLSYAYFGRNEILVDILDLFKKEANPYVRVVLCWYPIVATIGKKNQFWLDLCKSKDSFIRDLAVLALGFSFIDSRSLEVTSALKEIILNEEHIYPKESALYSLGIINLGSLDRSIEEFLDFVANKERGIVQSAAIIAKYLLYYNVTCTNLLDSNADKMTWSHLVGLSFLKNPKIADVRPMGNSYSEYNWGVELFHYFVGNSVNVPDYIDDYKDVFLFQTKINKVMKKIWNSKIKRVFFLPVYFYFLYESFWWPLFILSYLSLYLERKNLEE